MHPNSVTCTALQDVRWATDSDGSATDDLAVFRVALPDIADRMPCLLPLLSPDETARAGRYHQPDDALRFIGTRGVLRVLLARYTNQSPGSIEFAPGPNRKPELKHPGGWQFNVSHAGSWVLIAIGKHQVGVDLDRVNPDFPFRDIMDASFSPAERQYIEACADARRGFFELWTRKEALVKATAKGIDDEFNQILSLPGTHPVDARLLGSAGHWTVSSFTVADGYPAAVAHNGPSSLIPCFYTVDTRLWI